MNKRFFIGLLAVVASMAVHANSAPSFGPDTSKFLGGEEGDSCTVIMCLSDPAGQDLGECSDALQKFEQMRPEERPEFLKKCPKETGGGDE